MSITIHTLKPLEKYMVKVQYSYTPRKVSRRRRQISPHCRYTYAFLLVHRTVLMWLWSFISHILAGQANSISGSYSFVVFPQPETPHSHSHYLYSEYLFIYSHSVALISFYRSVIPFGCIKCLREVTTRQQALQAQGKRMGRRVLG